MERNILTRTAELAVYVTKACIQEGDLVIDATCGNGHDTLKLAETVGETGTVLAVDLQQQAVDSSRTRIERAGISNVIWIRGSFTELELYRDRTVPGKDPAAVVFNLGYLPGGDKGVTTEADQTLKAAQDALRLIRPGGIVTMVMYPGHPEGKLERDELLAWAETLDSRRFHTMYAALPNQKRNPPEILWITKKQ